MIHILHIANSYGGTEVYTNLCKSIDDEIHRQTVFVPLNISNHDRLGKKLIDFKNKDSRIIYDTSLKTYHRILYGLKIKKVVSRILEYVDIHTVDIIHAGTLCFDGAVAYELHKLYNIPYVVAVRNTDVNDYYRVFKWRHNYFSKILAHASRIVFISPIYKEMFYNKFVVPTNFNSISDKTMVIPNGVNEQFILNENSKPHILGKNIRLIFVAAFYKDKGLLETIYAIELLRDKGMNISIRAIGKGLPHRPMDKNYIKLLEQYIHNKPWVQLEDFKNSQEIIQDMRQSDVFVMVSSPETFGLVYVEALTQKIPIVYTKGQGFDGFFPDGYVGFPAEAHNVESISEAIEKVITNYPMITNNIQHINLKEQFDWDNIGRLYKSIYVEELKYGKE